MAHTDPLTGLANERTVGRSSSSSWPGPDGQGSEVSLAMFDVDDFRATNRDGGNEAGDDVLRQVAAVLAESVRLVDTVGRIGGDEFVLVAPGSAGSVVAQRVLDGIAALPAVGGRVVSVSAGVARFPADGDGRPGAHRRGDRGPRQARERRSRARGRVGGAGPRADAPPGLRSRRPFETTGPVGAVAPGPGSRVSAMTMPGATGGAGGRERRRPVAPDLEAAEGDRDVVGADDPRRVDRRAARRGEVLHRQRDLPGRADRGEAGPRPAVRGQDRGQRAGLAGRPR